MSNSHSAPSPSSSTVTTNVASTGGTKRIAVRFVKRRRGVSKSNTKCDSKTCDNGISNNNRKLAEDPVSSPVTDDLDASLTIESLLDSLPMEGQENENEQVDCSHEVIPQTPKKTPRRPSLGQRIVQTLVAPLTPNKNGAARRRNSIKNDDDKQQQYSKSFSHNSSPWAPWRRRLSMDGSSPTNDSNKTPVTPGKSPKKTPRRNSASMQQSFSNFLGHLSFSNLHQQQQQTPPVSKRSQRVMARPFGKEFVQYAQNSTETDLMSLVDSCSFGDGPSTQSFSQGTAVSIQQAHDLQRVLEKEITLHSEHKQRLTTACEQDWELAMARRESSGGTTSAAAQVAIRRLYGHKMERAKHVQVLDFLQTLRVVVQAEIQQATTLAEISSDSATSDDAEEPILVVMPITMDGLREELDFMETDWNTLNVDYMMDQELPDNKADLFQENHL